MTNSYLLDQARELALREAGLAVVVTHRPDGTTQASVVNAGIVDHPITGEPVVGFVVQGGARKKPANLRVKPEATVVFRSGWGWVAIEGDADLVGPDDRLDGVRSEAVVGLFHDTRRCVADGCA